MSWKNPIRSDDPEAITKLQAQIDACEIRQLAMKAANKVVKGKKLTDAEKVSALNKQGIDSNTAWGLLSPDFCGRVGFPSYELTNNSANMRRMKLRIEGLRVAA